MAKSFTHTVRSTTTAWSYTGPAQTRRKAAAAAAQSLMDNSVSMTKAAANTLFGELLNGPAPETVVTCGAYEAFIEEA